MKVKYGPCIWFFYGRNDHNDENDDTGTVITMTTTLEKERCRKCPKQTYAKQSKTYLK